MSLQSSVSLGTFRVPSVPFPTPMRALTLLGVLAILAGGYILVSGLSFTRERNVLEVGPFKAAVEERQAVPTWVGGLAVGVGLVMVIAGARSRSRT